jgi:uncharacterized protein YndB with AHSA1/START domain
MAARNPDIDINAEQPVQHASFTIERTFDASPAQVYAAFATLEGKLRWFAGTPGSWEENERVFDFRVGGRERLVGTWQSGMVSAFDACYWDIVPDRRIVYSYGMHLNDLYISVSLATIEFTASGTGTRLKITEQGAFLNGYQDGGSRERGTNELIDKLAATL